MIKKSEELLADTGRCEFLSKKNTYTCPHSYEIRLFLQVVKVDCLRIYIRCPNNCTLQFKCLSWGFRAEFYSSHKLYVYEFKACNQPPS